MKNLKNKIISSFIVVLGLVFAYGAQAQISETRFKLSPFAFTKSENGEAGDIAGFVVGLYKFLVGIAGIAAVGMIVAGGVLYATSSVVNKKGEGLDMIKSAIIGLILLLGSFVIIITINPNLLKLGTLSLPECKGMTDDKPGQNCLPKIVPPTGLCKNDGSLVPNPDTGVLEPEKPGVNCRANPIGCVEAFAKNDPSIKTMEDVQKLKGCYPGIVSGAGNDCLYKYKFFEKTITDERAAEEELKKFCGDTSLVLGDVCSDLTKCRYSVVTACTLWKEYGKNEYGAHYQVCNSGGENFRTKRWVFYKANSSPSPETAECEIWSWEEKLVDEKYKGSSNYGQWIINEGGHTPDGKKAC